MKTRFAALLLFSLVACARKPPIYLQTRSAPELLVQVKSARLEVQPLVKVELRDFKRAFAKQFPSEAAFRQAFQTDLAAALVPGAGADSPTYRVELPLLDVGSHTVSNTTMIGAGPGMTRQTTITESCDLSLHFTVVDAQGRAVLNGIVKESNAESTELFHPNTSKLVKAVDNVQKHLVEYLRGRMAAENIATSPEPPPAPRTN